MRSDNQRKTGSDGKIGSTKMTTHEITMIETTLLSMTKGKGENEATRCTTNVGIRITDEDITTEEMSIENRITNEIRTQIE